MATTLQAHAYLWKSVFASESGQTILQTGVLLWEEAAVHATTELIDLLHDT